MTALLLVVVLAGGVVEYTGAEYGGGPDLLMSAPLHTSGHLSAACTAADGGSCALVLDCGVGVYDAGTEWQCLDGAGANAALTYPAAAAYASGPFGMQADGGSAIAEMGPLTDGTAPYLPAATAAAMGLDTLMTQDQTVQCIYGANTPSQKMPFGYGLANADGLYLSQNGGSATCVWSASATIVTPVSVNAGSGYLVHTCQREGSTFRNRANGSATTTTSATVPVAPTAKNLYFGRYNSTTFALTQQIARCRIWSGVRSAANLTRDEALWFGGVAGSRNIATTRATPAWMEPPDGYDYAWGNGAPRVHPAYGLLSFEARTNSVTNSLSLSSQTDIGTPVVTSDSTSGPFARYNGGAEADTLDDNDAAAAEGKRSATLGTAAATYMTARYIKAGTQTSATLAIVPVGGTGGGGGSCVFSGLTTFSTATCSGTCGIQCNGGTCASGAPTFFGGFARLWCSAATTGTATTIHADVYPGDSSVVADMGTIIVSQSQGGATSTLGPPIVSGAAAQTVNADLHTTTTTGWPTTRGQIEIDYTPVSATTGVNRALLDSRVSGPLSGLVLYVNTSNALVLSTRAGALSSVINSAVLTWTANVQYRIKIRWGGGNLYVYRDGVLVASATAGTAVMPDGHNATVRIGHDVVSTSHANGWLKNLRVTR